LIQPIEPAVCPIDIVDAINIVVPGGPNEINGDLVLNAMGNRTRDDAGNLIIEDNDPARACVLFGPNSFVGFFNGLSAQNGFEIGVNFSLPSVNGTVENILTVEELGACVALVTPTMNSPMGFCSSFSPNQ